jgi:hypothetical protein
VPAKRPHPARNKPNRAMKASPDIANAQFAPALPVLPAAGLGQGTGTTGRGPACGSRPPTTAAIFPNSATVICRVDSAPPRSNAAGG